MKTRSAVRMLCAAAMAAGSLTITGAPVFAADAVSNVQVSWANANQDTVRVSWQETGAQPNHIRVVIPDLRLTDFYTASTDPNTIDLPLHEFQPTRPGDPSLRQVAVAIGEQGGTDMGEARSVSFDATMPPTPVVDDLGFASNGGVTVRWHAGPANPDDTPGDPLDAARSDKYTVYRGAVGSIDGFDQVSQPSTATTATLAGPVPDLVRYIPAETGAWVGPDGAPDRYSHQDGLDATGLQPVQRTSGTYGTRAVLTGKVWLQTQGCDRGSVCYPIEDSDAGHLILVQARKDAASPWAPVGSAKATGTGDSSSFSVPVSVPGTRQYRVVAVNKDGGVYLQLGQASAAWTMRAVTRVLSARFADSTLAYGQRATASLSVSPAGSQRATLQYRDAKGVWHNLKWVYLRAGKGSYGFAATRRGSTAYRFVVPGSTAGGYPVDGVTTAAFTLRVS